MDFQVIRSEDEEFIVGYIEGYGLRTMRSDHPNFERMVELLDSAPEELDPVEVGPLFDPAEAIQRAFERITERVSVKNGHIYFDGDVLNDALTELIVRLMEAGEDFMPFVLFLEKVMQNPQEESRRMLFSWIQAAGDGMAITSSGDVVGFKGASGSTDEATGEKIYVSSNYGGSAIVNGETFTGAIPYAVGDIVEMPRSEVTFDPGQSCSSGLHVGTRTYAKGFASSGGVVFEVHVNPRDVVSVPKGEHQKVRVCRFRIAGTDDGQDYGPLVREEEPEEPEVTDALDDDSEPEIDHGLDPDYDPDVDDEEDEDWTDDDEDGSDAIGFGVDEEDEEPQSNGRTLRNPTPQEFDDMASRAKRRHRGFVTYASTVGGWHRVHDGDSTQPSGWLLEA